MNSFCHFFVFLLYFLLLFSSISWMKGHIFIVASADWWSFWRELWLFQIISSWFGLLFKAVIGTYGEYFFINDIISALYLIVFACGSAKISFLFIAAMQIIYTMILFQPFFQRFCFSIIDFLDFPKVLQIHFLSHSITD